MKNVIKWNEKHEYVLVSESVLPGEIISTIENGIVKPIKLSGLVNEEAVIEIRDLHSEWFAEYTTYMPPVQVNDSSSGYGLEIDLLRLNETNPVILGGEGKSHRYTACLIVLGERDVVGEIYFPTQNFTTQLKRGMVIIIPSYFPYRFSYKPININEVEVITIYTTMNGDFKNPREFVNNC